MFIFTMHFSTTIISLLAVIHQTVAVPTTNADVMDRETFYNLTLPEYTPDGLKIVDLRNPKLETRAVCNGTPGIANGECLRYYSQQGCPDVGLIKGYKPTCNNNCYVDEFASVKVSGDGTYSTNCEFFSDTACQNSLGSLGSKTGNGACANKSGWSMKCYYRC
ncbi:hypothetical protein V8C42DRAFT_338649 [Trichoderma barbatum]